MAKFNHIDVRGTKKVPSAFGNVFISADSISAAKTVTFPDGYLNGATPEPNLAFKVVFANGHNAANASSYLSLNGVVVVSNQNGTLAPLPIHEMTEGGSTVYKVLDANTALELYYTEDYDGNGTPAFVVVGNPLVLSSSTYSIYANGYNDFDLTMLDYSNVTTLASVSINSLTPINIYQATAHCRLYVVIVAGSGDGIFGRLNHFYINGNEICMRIGINAAYAGSWVNIIDLNKGDQLSMSKNEQADANNTVTVSVIPYKA